MINRNFHRLARRLPPLVTIVTLLALQTTSLSNAWPMNAVRGAALPQPLPLFPAGHWWNLDISSWPVDPNSTNFVAFINNGGTRRLHPDFGGNAGSGNAVYGMPYAVVTNATDADLKPVQFQYGDESDGVDHSNNTSFPFYPIPSEAITQPYWIEGGDPGNIDLRSSEDRHLLIVDKDRNFLYELYNVFYNTTQGKWFAGSGAFFDMNTNNRRPDGWTSADAAGLAILPGLVRYDEVYDPNNSEIHHALRVTVRATNGYVYPASHRAGSTAGALPMGARLRLKASVDITQRTSDPNVQKIFRAMQKYGLIVADNGSDMYITGTYDTRWNNDVLNPAFANLSASDFEVIQLGYNAAPTSQPTLSSVGLNPSSIAGGQSVTGTVTLSGPAPSGGAPVTLSSANPAASVPISVIVPANSFSANFVVTTTAVTATTAGNIAAAYAGASKSAALTVNPPAPAGLSSLILSPTKVTGGSSASGTFTLTQAAPAGGVVVTLGTSDSTRAQVPTTVLIPAGAVSKVFTITTTATKQKTNVSITASYAGISKSATVTIVRR